jgi:hypothetical protein
MGPDLDAYRIRYRENVMLALQEQKDQFGDAFSMIEKVDGKQLQIVDLIGEMDARQDAPEGGDTPDIEAQHEPVWVRPTRLDWGKIMKIEDVIKALTDFKSEYVQGGVKAITRKKNRILAQALFGNRLIGNEVPVSTAWAGSTVATDFGSSGTPNRMSVPKLNNAIRLMEDAFIDIEMEDLYLVLNPQQNEELYTDITFTSRDYRTEAKYDQRRVKEIMGIPILSSKNVPPNSGTEYSAALFCRSGMWWGNAMPVTVKSAPNPAKQYREHPYIETWIAATRSEDKKVVKILTKI